MELQSKVVESPFWISEKPAKNSKQLLCGFFHQAPRVFPAEKENEEPPRVSRGLVEYLGSVHITFTKGG